MYSQDLIDLLTLEIPVAPRRDATFFDITGQGHREVVLSRVYAYYLNRRKNEILHEVFITALADLIAVHTNRDFNLTDSVVSTERMTDKGNRIDLLLESKTDGKAIIIENKVYHLLNNDLHDYFNSVKLPADNKIGIVLTLFPMTIPTSYREQFINITHQEWMDFIKRRGLPAGLPAQQYVYLNDLFTNISNLTQSAAMDEQANFFFKHTDKVLTAISTYDKAYEYVVQQLRVAGEKLGLPYKANGEKWGYLWDGKANAYYVIGFERLLNGQRKLKFIIQMNKNGRGNYDQVKQALDANPHFATMQTDPPTPQWVNIAWRYYDLTEDDIQHLSDFVVKNIQTDFEPILKEILISLKNA
ncbi:MAG: PD-(D/E)XK nuclease family protein [Flavipsychrobacter sp.]|nr:PD-(D/E)XK nuclease family protein [Flavipsychrobacter sp.]